MKKIVTIIFIMISICFFSISSYAEYTTYHETTRDIGIRYESPIDLKLALQSIKFIDNFFEELGFDTKPPKIRISFQDKVEIRYTVNGDMLRVYGFTDRKKHLIQVTSYNSDWIKSRTIFECFPNKRLHKSIIIHELAHLYASFIAKKNIGRAYQEYIAYTAQLSSLRENDRKVIFKRYKMLHGGSIAFDSISNINTIVYGADVHLYGVKCYNQAISDNFTFMKKMLKGNSVPMIPDGIL